MRFVVLTDTEGNPTGLSEIIEAHTGEGKLHRAFSAYVFRRNGREILIQKRSGRKMLFPLLWANTCCSHPFPDEDTLEAGRRRLREECGLSCDLREVGAFVYHAEDPGGRGIEHEHVTLLRGDMNDEPVADPVEGEPDPDEIEEMRWISIEELLADMKEHSNLYAPWFHLGLRKILSTP